MKYEYKYDLVDGHVVMIDGANHLLLDTGAPSSVGSPSPLSFAGANHEVSDNYMGVTPDSLSASIGAPINSLIGTDILNQFDMLIDPELSVIMLSEEEIPADGDCLHLDEFMGIPIIEAVVSGETVRMFFDSGAKLSYLNSELSEEFPTAGEASDFYPGLGEFTTNTHSVLVGIGSRALTLRVGTLPELLQATLMMANTGGILGTAVLDTCKVLFAPRRKMIFLQDRQG